MTRTPRSLFAAAQLTTSAAIYYTGGANTVTTISAFSITNTSGTARTVDVHLVAAGGTAGVTNKIASAIVIPASGNAPVIISAAIGQSIIGAGTIEMLADANSAITPYASGYVTTL